MNLIVLTEKLIAERGYGDEMLAMLTGMIDADLNELSKRRSVLLDEANNIVTLQEALQLRKAELATEFATRRAALSALIGEEGGNE